jgi:Family of unknown function (DUF6600)/FecR protein
MNEQKRTNRNTGSVGKRWSMKNKFMASSSVLIMALACALSMSAQVPTTDEGSGPTEQPSAPMEMGQEQAAGPQQGGPGPQAPPDAEAQPGGPSGEGPARTDQGVARVSMTHGEVSTQRGDSGDWSAAVANQPVMTGDKVSTGDGSRTELQLDFANIVRLGPNSKANIANLTRKDIQIQLSQGILNYTVSKDSETEPEVDTPNVSVHPSHHDGVFRIEVRPDGDTVVIVRKGEAQISTPQGSTEVHSGEMATVRGDSTSAQYKISQAPDRDDWDRWNSERDHMIQNAHSWHHTNRYFTGSEDLDANGQWRNVPDYGDVWVPNEPEGWTPYRDGNWTYEPYYGWTWVGYEPWGWAPYHYGRWLSYGGAWGWWPGPVGGFYRPFWAPAYVSFFGWGGGFGFGFGFGGWGGFGWLPIGPCDRFHPWWGGYGGRFGVLNARFGNNGRFGGFAPLHGGTRFSNIANIHDNHVGRALSTVNAAHFGAGRVSAVAATREQINGAKMMAGNMPVVPSRASLSASGRAAAPSTVRNGSERFFGAVHNNVARPASFQQQTAHLQQTMQQNHVSAVTAGGRTSTGESSMARSAPSSTMEKPSAGTQSNRETGNSNRETNNSANRSAGTSSAENGNHGAYRPFTPPNASNTRTSPSSSPSTTESRSGNFSRPTESRPTESRPTESRPTESRPTQNQSTANSSRDGFRPFTPPSHSEVSRGESGASASSGARGSSGSYWNRTAPSSMERGYGSSSSSYGRGSSSSRPQLDMRQPIVRGPSYGAERGGERGGYYGGSRSVPSYGGSHSAPSYGGSHSAPSSGGHSSSGHSSSGGGHASSGHSSGGGHSGGGHR